MSGKKRKELDALLCWLHAHPKAEYGCYALLALLAAVLFFTGSRGAKTQAEMGKAEKPAAQELSSEETLEERLQTTLSAIEGAGRVTVLISYASEEEIVPALSVSVQQSEGGTQSRSEQPVTVGGGSEEQPMVLTRRAAVARGALIVAEGAADVSVRMNLQRAAQAVLDLPAAKIEVFSMETDAQD